MAVRCHDSVCMAIERRGISCDEVDVDALIDQTLSCTENQKEILKSIGKGKSRRDKEYYESMYREIEAEMGKKVRRPCIPPVRVRGHCRKACTIKVRPYRRSCPTRRIR